MTLGMVGVLLGLCVAALYLALRIAEVTRQWREPTTRWVKRSPVDRRQRQIPVAVERRRGPRRQEEIAGLFLAEMGDRRMRRPARPLRPAPGRRSA